MDETAVRSKLLAYAPLTALIDADIRLDSDLTLYSDVLLGSSASSFAPILRVGKLPAITYKQISASRQQYGVLQPLYQYSLWASTYAGVKELEAAFIAALDDVNGTSNIFAKYINNKIVSYEEDTKIYSMFIDVEYSYLAKENFEE